MQIELWGLKVRIEFQEINFRIMLWTSIEHCTKLDNNKKEIEHIKLFNKDVLNLWPLNVLNDLKLLLIIEEGQEWIAIMRNLNRHIDEKIQKKDQEKKSDLFLLLHHLQDNNELAMIC